MEAQKQTTATTLNNGFQCSRMLPNVISKSDDRLSLDRIITLPACLPATFQLPDCVVFVYVFHTGLPVADWQCAVYKFRDVMIHQKWRIVDSRFTSLFQNWIMIQWIDLLFTTISYLDTHCQPGKITGEHIFLIFRPAILQLSCNKDFKRVNRFTGKKESSNLSSSEYWDFNPILDSLNRESWRL